MKTKRSFDALFIAFVLGISLALGGCGGKGNTAAFAGGSGTETDPYQIATAQQLELVQENLAASFLLTDNIDLTAYENWVPLGNVTMEAVNFETGETDFANAFSGTFDGGGFTISNLNCDADENAVAAGLFGCMVGSIKNLTVENAVVTGTESNMAIGGVIGYGLGAASNITLAGKNTVKGINCVGGIVGGNMGKVTDCKVEATDIVVIGDNDFSKGEIVQNDVAQCGGLVVGGSFKGSVDQCSAEGTVTAEGNEPVGLGGIAGCIQSISSITGNTATVKITANNGHAIGGLCGYAGIGDDGDGTVDAPCAITNCKITVDIDAKGATHTGGLVGTGLYYYGMEDRFTIENCTVNGTIDGAITPGTVAGRGVGSTIISCDANVLIDGAQGEEQIGTTDRMYQSADQYEDGSAEAATRFIEALEGTYEELWPVAFQNKYDAAWFNSSAACVGEEKAQGAVDRLKSMIGGEIYGQKAVDAYAKNPESAVYDCYFKNGVEKIAIKGNSISGADASGKELFSHTYHFTGYDEAMGFYQFESEDKNSGEYTYFFLRGDTPAATWHTEFRYGSDAAALLSMDTGAYAYWMAAGIPTDYDDAMVQNAINLFCTENLSEQ